MQTVMEYSWKHACNGEIFLSSEVEAQPYYWKKINMRCTNPQHDEIILKDLESPFKRSICYWDEPGKIQMYLPFEAIEKWKECILEKPILFKSLLKKI